MSNYYIGLDIGTDSVGWAVTDPQYQILKKHGKALWGVRLFSEANKAEERRGFRTARRRLERRNQRIEWLREIFSEEIAKVDPAFFLRIDESKFIESDKKVQENGMPLGRYTLFADRAYCDRDYHREFPTIYHLRRALMFEKRPFDVRLVYLAVHHILKKRGHFLFEDISLDDVTFDSCLKDLQQHLHQAYDVEFELDNKIAFAEILTDRSLGISRKKSALRKAAGVSKDQPQLCAIVDLLAGAKVKASVVSGIELSSEDDRSFSFSENYENAETELAEILGDDMQLVHQIKKLYDFGILDELKNGEAYISCAKVKVYEQHECDLARLKALMKPHKKIYREMFRCTQDKLDNYVAYSGHGAQNYRCDYGKFCAYAKKQLKALLPKLDEETTQEAECIIASLDVGLFLPKQTSKNNGVIPHQLHEQELEIILECASQYTDKVHSDLTRNRIYYAHFEDALRQLSPETRAIIYTSQIGQMLEFAKLADNGQRKICCLWGLYNIDHKMSDEQLCTRSAILKTGLIPAEIDLLFINAAYETSINIKNDDFNTMIIHNGNTDVQVQVRGRLRHDIDTLYLYDAEHKHVSQYLQFWHRQYNRRTIYDKELNRS